jgi:uncharacterized protein
MTFNWSDGPLGEGLRCYNAAEFFAAHEHWESIWLHAPQPEKIFLQALIQVTVAMHHLTRNNPLGATRLLTAALRKLEPLPPGFANLNVAQLREDISAYLHSLEANNPPEVGTLSVGAITHPAGAVILNAVKDPCICTSPKPTAPRILPILL